MNKYYVIKATDEETKEVIYLKMPHNCIFTKNLSGAKLFSNYETAKKCMEYVENNNPQTPYVDEIIEVEVDQYGSVVEIEGGNKAESNVAEMNFVKVEISGVEINVTTNQQVACVETATNSVKVMFEQAKPREITLNIDGKMLGQSIVGGIETIKQKNTPKGAYVGKCPNHRTRTAYPKYLTVEPLENFKVFDKITKAICVTIRDTLSR